MTELFRNYNDLADVYGEEARLIDLVIYYTHQWAGLHYHVEDLIRHNMPAPDMTEQFTLDHCLFLLIRKYNAQAV